MPARRFGVEILAPLWVASVVPSGSAHRVTLSDGNVAVARAVILMHESAGRISNLVGTVKAYSYMDQAPLQHVAIHAGIESTLTMLAHHLRGVTIVRDYAADLPTICAYGSELNQVWTNLLDNASDALGGQGTITIRTARQDGVVLVEVGDDGPGIPPEVQRRLFEPFITTKPVGEGIGLGLDTVYRIVVTRHRGEVRIRLPDTLL